MELWNVASSLKVPENGNTFLLSIIFFHLIHSSFIWRFHSPHELSSTNFDNIAISEHILPVLPRMLELNDWILSWDTWAFPFPITNAAATLERFYDAITESVIREWSSMDPLHSFSVRIGLFEMRFDCDEAPIPWQMVSFVSRLLADEATIGWAGLYQIRLHNTIDRIALRVALKLIAPGDGG
ncbi:MAG: hypothetical protein Q9195_001529 [Heterodermia aff. obscurata]